jgi:hypothetical protein
MTRSVGHWIRAIFFVAGAAGVLLVACWHPRDLRPPYHQVAPASEPLASLRPE